MELNTIETGYDRNSSSNPQINGTLKHGDGGKRNITVLPRGKIINDHHNRRDDMGTHIYGKVISDCLREVDTPLTVGILSSWGTGKSFLVDQVRENLRKSSKSENGGKCGGKCASGRKFLYFLLLTIPIAYFIYMLIPCIPVYTTDILSSNSTAPPVPVLPQQKELVAVVMTIFAVVSFFLFSLSLFRSVDNSHAVKSKRTWSLGYLQQLKLMFVCFFTEVPHMKMNTITKHKHDSRESTYAVGKHTGDEGTSKENHIERNFVHVHFNAWEHMGSDILWAAIITHLTDEMENYFGKYLCRLFRTIRLKTYDNAATTDKSKDRKPFSLMKHLHEHPAYYYGLSRLFWAAWILLCCIISIIIFAMHWKSLSKAVNTSIVATGSAGCFLVTLRKVLDMFNSQRRRIESAIKGTRKNMVEQLGFMNKVRFEVQMIELLIWIAEFIFGQEYKVFIVIDDLDRIPHKKVKSILDSIRLLLSDPYSPFISIVAVDSRIAVKSIENELGPSLIRANINGYEYLKNHHLAILYAQDQREKKKLLVMGHLQDSDIWKESKPQQETFHVDQCDAAPGLPEGKVLNHEEFLFECRYVLSKDQLLLSLVGSNPREIKRLLNVVTITCHLINALIEDSKKEKGNVNFQTTGTVIQRTEAFAEKLMFWIILCEVWPYRASLIIYTIDYEPSSYDTLLDIYTKQITPKMSDLHVKNEEDPSLLSLDESPLNFVAFLKHMVGKKGEVKKSDVKKLLDYTIHLDANIYNVLSVDKEVNDLEDENMKKYGEDLMEFIKRAINGLNREIVNNRRQDTPTFSHDNNRSESGNMAVHRPLDNNIHRTAGEVLFD